MKKNKWDAGQLSKITADDGKAYERINANDPSILDKLIKLPGVHSWYIHEAHPDLPTKSSMRTLSVFSENTYGWIIGANNTGDVYINRSTTDVTGTQQEWSGWKQLVTNAEFEHVTWLSVTLDKSSSIGDRPVEYVKWGNLLLLRGHLKANREIICGRIPAEGLPEKGLVVSVPVSGTTGHSKLYIYQTGELKLTGLHAVNNSGVTGYYLDTVDSLN